MHKKKVCVQGGGGDIKETRSINEMGVLDQKQIGRMLKVSGRYLGIHYRFLLNAKYI